MNDPKTPTIPPGAYANFLQVALAPSEFHLAFAQLAPGARRPAQLVASLVTAPVHAKAMLRALAKTVERYEEQFGEIPVIEPKPEPVAASPADEPPAAAGSEQRRVRGARGRRG
jgi:hypothetical protein